MFPRKLLPGGDRSSHGRTAARARALGQPFVSRDQPLQDLPVSRGAATYAKGLRAQSFTERRPVLAGADLERSRKIRPRYRRALAIMAEGFEECGHLIRAGGGLSRFLDGIVRTTRSARARPGTPASS